MLDLDRVAAHYAISTAFEQGPGSRQLYAFTVDPEETRRFEAGAAKLLIGRARLTSNITRDAATITYGVVHMGDHHVNGAVRRFEDSESFEAMTREISDTFLHSDFPDTIRRLDKHFDGNTYSLRALFRDEQRRIVNAILANTLQQAAANLRLIFESHAPLMTFLTDLNIPQPRVLRSAARFVLSTELREIVEHGLQDASRVAALLNDARIWNLALDVEGLAYSVAKLMNRWAEDIRTNPSDVDLLLRCTGVVQTGRTLPIELNLWQLQNAFDEILDTKYAEMRQKAESGDEGAGRWMEAMRALGEQVKVALPNQ